MEPSEEKWEAFMVKLEAKCQELFADLRRIVRAPAPSPTLTTSAASNGTVLPPDSATTNGAQKVFDGMPGHQEANTGRVLRVTVSQVFYPVTEEVLHQVFDAYGAEKVCDLEVADRTEALVLFRSSHDAVRARDAYHGRCIYDNCCWLDLRYVQPLPTNSTPVMPIKCSMPCLSHDAEKPKAASTPVVASPMPLTTSVAMATTSFAQIKAEQPGACKVFVGMPRKTESEAKYHRFVKWVPRVHITRRPVRWAMRSKHGSSGCEVKVSDVKEDNAAQGDVLDTELKHTVELDLKQPTKVFDEMPFKSAVVLWPHLVKSVGWRPWPPPIQFLSGVCAEMVFLMVKRITHSFGEHYKNFPSVVCYNALINGYGMLGRMEEARELVCEMKAKGVNPDVVTYSTILNGYCKIGDTDSAFQLNRQMLKKGVLPAAITYSSLIRGLCEERRLNDACELFEKMLQLGLQPDEFTYTTLIAGHCKEGSVEKALSLHDAMIKKGVLPDVVTYSVLINGLSKSACTKGAQRLLFKLYYEDPVPANIKYDALMHCCSKAEFKSVVALPKGFCMKGLMNEADKVYQSMLDRNWNLDGSVYSVLIHGHCRGGNVSKALSFHKQMLQCGFSPNSTSTISLVRGLFEEGMTVEADNVIQELLNCCSLADAETSKALIDLNRKEGNVDAVVDVLCGMTRDGLLPSSG